MKFIATLTVASIALIAGVFIGKAEPINCEGIGRCQTANSISIRRSF